MGDYPIRFYMGNRFFGYKILVLVAVDALKERSGPALPETTVIPVLGWSPLSSARKFLFLF